MLALRCVLEAEINQQSHTHTNVEVTFPHSHRVSSFVLLASRFRRLLILTLIVVKDTRPSTMWIQICEQICPDVQMDSLRAFAFFCSWKETESPGRLKLEVARPGM